MKKALDCPRCGNKAAELIGELNSGCPWWWCPRCLHNWVERPVEEKEPTEPRGTIDA